MVWSVDDSKLITCGMDGAVYEWSPTEAKRNNEVVLKTCAYSDLTVSGNGKCAYAVGSDKTIKEITESQVKKRMNMLLLYVFACFDFVIVGMGFNMICLNDIW